MTNHETFNDRNGLEIAIIGMAGRFPAARNVEELWQNLCNGVEAISFFTDEELEAEGISAEIRNQPNFVRAGGVLEDIEMFDASFFGLTPREAEIVDPQQRFFLECAWEALENAGYDPENYKGSIGVCAGVGLNGYLVNIYSNRDLLESVGSFLMVIGNDKDHLTTRVAYKLNLKGPGITVQTACSTSLVAVHLGCQALLSATCDMVLAGGVSIKIPQKTGYLYQEGAIMSPDGHCRAFDAKAQGTVGGNGVGIVVLKRLEDALAEGDYIYAVIKGSAINNDGSSKVGYTAPSVSGQANVIRAALAMAEVEPESVRYVETHGTGTPLGDPIEVSSLKEAFGMNGKRGYCAIGSVKTNLGHLDTAAGVTGLIKTALALKHGLIPPSLHFERSNPQIDFDNSPFYVNTQLAGWSEDARPRRAGVSSFGIGGTNAHVILEEAPIEESDRSTRPWQLLPLSTRTDPSLERATSNLAEYIRTNPGADPADIAYTLQAGRRAFKRRRVVICRTMEDAARSLATLDPDRVFTSASEPKEKRLVFMFPGQGTQYANMGLELYKTERLFREQIDLCAGLLAPHLDRDLREIIYPNDRDRAKSELLLTETFITQPALFAFEYALARLWMSWGLRPQAMIGHSIGEYVAASLSGVFSLEDALMIVAARGRLMQSLPAGTMLAVPLSEAELQPLLSPRLSLAATNGPSFSVVSGPAEDCSRFEARLSQSGIACRRLQTSHAFHSEMMAPILSQFKESMERVKLNPPVIPYISNFTGSSITPEQATDPAYWVNHLRYTVRFVEGVSELLKQDCILLEVGPGETLCNLVRRHADKNGTHVIVSTLGRARKSDSDTASMLTALGQLWLNGKKVDWPAFSAHQKGRRLPLPTYPFERLRYWVERNALMGGGEPKGSRLRKEPDIADWFYVPVWKQSVFSPQSGTEEPAGQAGSVLVFLDEVGLGSRLVERMKLEGRDIVSVVAGDGFARLGDGEFTIDPTRRDDYDSLLIELKGTGKTPSRVIHLWGVTSDVSIGPGPDEENLRSFYSLLLLAQSVGEQIILPSLSDQARIEPIHISVISNNTEVVTGEESVLPEKATVFGPCRVIPQEYPNITCRNIDIALPEEFPDQAEDLVARIVEELESSSADPLVALRGVHRWVQVFDPIRLEAPPSIPALLRERGVYLITGGLGGVGLELARHIGETARADLALVGRSAFPERAAWGDWLARHGEHDEVSRKIRALEEIEKCGARVLTLSADIADERAMRDALAGVVREFGQINGVIHAAGIPPTSIIQRKSTAMASSALSAKVKGTRVLENLLKDANLDFFALCSSMRSIIGGIGASDYTAANAFLDAFARSNNLKNGTVVTSIIWDGWRETGMGANASSGPALEEGLGAGMLSSEGVDVFRRILCARLPEVIVSMHDFSAVIEESRALFASRRLEESGAGAALRPAHSRPDLATAYVAPTNDVEQALAGIWERLLGIDRVGIHDNFFELGGDSVVSIQVIAKANEAGVRLTPKQVFESQTIAELAKVAGLGPRIEAEQGLVTGALPLTPVQRWFFEQEFSSPHHWNQARLLVAHQPLDPRLLEEVLHALLSHHDELRARFYADQSGWSQYLTGPDDDLPFITADLSRLSEAEQSICMEVMVEEAQSSLHLSDGPVLRAVLFDLGSDVPGRLLLIIHHLVIDVISWRILVEDLYTAYEQLLRGQAIELPFKSTSYKQWAERLAEHSLSEELGREEEYWLGLPWDKRSSLPVEYEPGSNRAASSRTVSVRLEAEKTESLLRDVHKAYNTQTNDLLLSALALAFAEWTGSRTLLVDLEGHGRDPIFEDVDVSRTVGWFTTIYPVVLDLEESCDAGEVLKMVKEQLRRLPNQGGGFGLLRYMRGEGEVAQRLCALPAPEISFLYLGQADQGQGRASKQVQTESPEPSLRGTGAVQSPESHRPYLLQINASTINGQLSVSMTYSESIHRRSTIERLAGNFIEALNRLIDHCLSSEAGGYTPSDLPEAGLSQTELDLVLAQISESDD